MRRLAPLLAVLLAAMHGPASADDANERQLSRFVRPDGRVEIYYAAGDEFLTTAFDILDEYWSRIATKGLNQLRGHLDNTLPEELKPLGHKPADAMMRVFADSFFASRNPDTGLIPHSYDSWSPAFLVRTGGKQPVSIIARTLDFMEWFPDDADLLRKSADLADATMKYFDFEFKRGRKGGMWSYVDAASGEPRSPVTLTLHYGSLGKAFAYLTRRTGDRRFLEWADQKMEFVWQMRLNRDLPILCDKFIPTTACMDNGWTSDTDTIYYVRCLFDIYRLSGDTKHRDWAMAVTDLWFDRAWNADWGHFIRKLRPDGTPAVDTLYGDAKYNTLEMLTCAYRVTKDNRYMDRFKQAWRGLMRMGRDGLVAEAMKQGQMTRQDLDPQQTIFISILLGAYEAAGDKELLDEAEAFGKRVLAAGRKVWRMEGCQAGDAFLRLALARRPVRRLEVSLGNKGASLVIARAGENLLNVAVPGEIAVVYLPEGEYEVRLGDGEAAKKQSVRMDGDKQMAF